MNNTIIANIIRFIGLVIVQVLVFKHLHIGGDSFNYISIIIYPIFLLLLPFRTPHPLLVFLGFVIGITVDAFYGTPGVHAGAGVFAGFVRPYILASLEPRGGYNMNYSPVKRVMGFNWFLRYSAAVMFIHLFIYFSIDAFTYYYIRDILLKTIFSFVMSMLFVILYQYILDPRE